MARGKPPHSPDNEFREAMSGVTPITQDKIPYRKQPDSPAAAESRRDSAEEPVAVESRDARIVDDEFHRGGLQRSVFRKFRQGQMRPERRIDLHGYREANARQLLLRFIHSASSDACRVVLVIHGKGSRSEDQMPILKTMAQNLLSGLNEVLAFTPATVRDGGSGASYVMLRAPKRKPEIRR